MHIALCTAIRWSVFPSGAGGSGGAGVLVPLSSGSAYSSLARLLPFLRLEYGWTCVCVCVDPAGLESADPLLRGTRTSGSLCVNWNVSIQNVKIYLKSIWNSTLSKYQLVKFKCAGSLRRWKMALSLVYCMLCPKHIYVIKLLQTSGDFSKTAREAQLPLKFQRLNCQIYTVVLTHTGLLRDDWRVCERLSFRLIDCDFEL